MNARTEFQILLGEDGKPAFVVVPYRQFQRMRGGLHHGGVPNAVVNHVFDHGVSPMAAWREHLGFTQQEMAQRMGVTQAAYAQMERSRQPRKSTTDRAAQAMGISAEQLRW